MAKVYLNSGTQVSNFCYVKRSEEYMKRKGLHLLCDVIHWAIAQDLETDSVINLYKIQVEFAIVGEVVYDVSGRALGRVISIKK